MARDMVAFLQWLRSNVCVPMVAFLRMICYPATEKSGSTAADPIEETGWMKFQTLACPTIKISE
jgi:hypothetical protein